MAWNQERSSVNQRIQVGAEATTALGTTVPANRLLQAFDLSFAIAADIQTYRATGRKYSSTQIENTEWVDGTMTGPIDYNASIYSLNGIMGAISPITHGVSATAKDWVFTPPVTGSIVPQTYTFEQGDTTTRAHRLAYGLFTDWGYKGDRKSGLAVSAKLIAQPITDGITMTNSPTAIALAPLAGKHVNFYLDTSSAGLGGTQLTKVLDIDFSFGGVYGPFYPFNRANIGWTAHVDMAPKTAVKLLMEADSTGMAILTNMQQGSTLFLRVNAQGLIIDNLQLATITGVPTGGTFTLTYKGQTTAGIAFNALASVVQTAFLGLSTVGAGNATVTGSAGGPYSIILAGTLAQDATAITASGAGLTGGSSPAITITQNQSYNVFQHDMAIKVSKPNPFSDKDGVFAEQWEFEIVEDSTWGKAQTITVTNLLTAL